MADKKEKMPEVKKVSKEEVQAMYKALHNALIDLGDETLLKSMQVDALSKGFASKLLGTVKAKGQGQEKAFVIPAKL